MQLLWHETSHPAKLARIRQPNGKYLMENVIQIIHMSEIQLNTLVWFIFASLFLHLKISSCRHTQMKKMMVFLFLGEGWQMREWNVNIPYSMSVNWSNWRLRYFSFCRIAMKCRIVLIFRWISNHFQRPKVNETTSITNVYSFSSEIVLQKKCCTTSSEFYFGPSSWFSLCRCHLCWLLFRLWMDNLEIWPLFTLRSLSVLVSCARVIVLNVREKSAIYTVIMDLTWN